MAASAARCSALAARALQLSTHRLPLTPSPRRACVVQPGGAGALRARADDQLRARVRGPAVLLAAQIGRREERVACECRAGQQCWFGAARLFVCPPHTAPLQPLLLRVKHAQSLRQHTPRSASHWHPRQCTPAEAWGAGGVAWAGFRWQTAVGSRNQQQQQARTPSAGTQKVGPSSMSERKRCPSPGSRLPVALAYLWGGSPRQQPLEERGLGRCPVQAAA